MYRKARGIEAIGARLERETATPHVRIHRGHAVNIEYDNHY